MKNQARSEYTIKNTSKALQVLHKHANLNNPEQVKQYIAQLNASTSYKRNLCIAYNKYCKFYQIKWEMPHYKPQSRMIKIPTKEKLEMLIAHAHKPTSTKLMISLECGLRPVEVCNLKVKDVDLQQRIIYPTTAKHGTPRALKISYNLQKVLQEHIIKHNLNPNDKLFKGDAENYGKYYRKARNSLAKKLQDPTIQTIRLYDFRHYFATMTYHKTRDILFTKQQMGHSQIKTTLIYTQLLNLDDDEWTCKTANTIEQATQLVEAGFEYITEIDGTKLFRKRKLATPFFYKQSS
jgi:integrase